MLSVESRINVTDGLSVKPVCNQNAKCRQLQILFVSWDTFVVLSLLL